MAREAALARQRELEEQRQLERARQEAIREQQDRQRNPEYYRELDRQRALQAQRQHEQYRQQQLDRQRQQPNPVTTLPALDPSKLEAPNIQLPAPRATATPAPTQASQVESKFRSLLERPVPADSTDRREMLEEYFQKLTPLQAARLLQRLSNPKDPLRQQLEQRVSKRVVPPLLKELQRSSLFCEPRPYPTELTDSALHEEFAQVTERLQARGNEPVTTNEQVVDEARRDELSAELQKRGQAFSPARQRLDEMERQEPQVERGSPGGPSTGLFEWCWNVFAGDCEFAPLEAWQRFRERVTQAVLSDDFDENYRRMTTDPAYGPIDRNAFTDMLDQIVRETPEASATLWLAWGSGLSKPSATIATLQSAGALRSTSQSIHSLAHPIKLKNQTIAIAEVRLPDGGRRVYGAANSSAGLTAAQRQQLEALGVEIVPMRGTNHAEINIIESLPPGTRVERWGISSGRHQRPLPCPECEEPVGRIGGTLEGK